MPTVPLYGQPRVQPVARPGGQRTDIPSPEAYGAGFGATVSAVGLTELRETIAEEVEKADQIALLAADNETSTATNELLYNPQTGALQKKGKDALGLPESVLAEYDAQTGAIAGKLTTDKQRLAYQRARQQRRQQLDHQVRVHTQGEMEAYEKAEVDTGLKNATADAIANAGTPRLIAQELERGEAIIIDYANRNGAGPEATAAMREGFRSAVHSGVINRLLAVGEDNSARAYLEETKDQISGAALGQLEGALEEGSARGASQRQADQILANTSTEAEARAAAKAIPDARLREDTLQLIEHEYGVREREKRNAEETQVRLAMKQIEQGGLRAISPAEWDLLPATALGPLRSYARQLAEGVPVKTDKTVLYARLTQAGEDPEGFLKRNLLLDRHKLSDQDFEELARLQLQIRQGNARANTTLDGFRTNTQIINKALLDIGLDPAAKAGTAARKAVDKVEAELLEELDRRVDLLQAGGKKLTNSEIQQELDDMLMTIPAYEPGSFWNLIPGGAPLFGRTGTSSDPARRRLVGTIGIEDIGPEERAVVEAELRRAGLPVDPDGIVRRYIAIMRRRGALTPLEQ